MLPALSRLTQLEVLHVKVLDAECNRSLGEQLTSLANSLVHLRELEVELFPSYVQQTNVHMQPSFGQPLSFDLDQRIQ